MKKNIIIFILFISSFLLISCGGLHDKNEVTAQDYILKESLTIQMPVKNAEQISEYSHFALKENIADISSIIKKNNENLEIGIFQDNYLLIPSKNTFFLIKKIPSINNEKENRYAFFAPIATFNINNEHVNFYLPYHLIKDIDVQYYPYGKEFGISSTYQTDETLNQFYDFYSNIELCETQVFEDYILVENSKTPYKMLIRLSGNRVTFEIKESQAIIE